MSDRGYRWAWRSFELLFRPWMRRRLHAVRVAGLGRAPVDGPLLVCPNHTSWWDGFLVRELQRRLRPHAPLHVVMLEEELRTRPFFRRLGALGLRPGSTASLRRLLRRLRTLREQEPDAVVAFFPQGRISPSFRRPLRFEEGVRLVVAALRPVGVLPLGIHVEAGTAPVPAAWLSVGAPLDAEEVAGPGGFRTLEARVEEELDAIHTFLAVHGEEALAKWPAAEASLPRAAPPAAAPPVPRGRSTSGRRVPQHAAPPRGDP